ncbi:hypothetical protein OIU76_000704 [Salix suchowensis]|uniref:Uncharacterized protein n=2 Tax=Salix TaxID=40685 RepID=A0A9Q0VIG7_SALPP|nr:hypothetical protein OIU76_000704 [Salix suchowensis]KAJ6375735.1 hypothetical protein OIU77_000658 [Salix suchowensis]KAJ6749222.1 hypothetical protein OIU79_030168 [Salix purpurea]
MIVMYLCIYNCNESLNCSCNKIHIYRKTSCNVPWT